MTLKAKGMESSSDAPVQKDVSAPDTIKAKGESTQKGGMDMTPERAQSEGLIGSAFGNSRLSMSSRNPTPDISSNAFNEPGNPPTTYARSKIPDAAAIDGYAMAGKEYWDKMKSHPILSSGIGAGLVGGAYMLAKRA